MVFSFIPIVLALSSVFPVISKLLASADPEKGQIIAMAARELTNAKSPEDIVKAFKDNSELKSKFDETLARMATEEELVAQDRQKARLRDVALLQYKKNNLRADIMVVAAALGLSVCLLSLIFYQKTMSGEAVGIISTIAGIFGSCLKDAYAFEFGSSRGSKEKDEQVASILRRYDHMASKVNGLK